MKLSFHIKLKIEVSKEGSRALLEVSVSVCIRFNDMYNVDKFENLLIMSEFCCIKQHR